ncbi:MAG TPA: glycine cleavage system aminomethyltransferase GcvT [Acidilobales archaeon]|nr:glycine cleavage system aminomethyltransferase GcvT [Acidilobales archaeon]
MPREVPLIDTQRKLGGSIGEFAGWLTSMDYGNPLEEHLAVRTSVGVFDVSHMGRYIIRGKKVFEFLQKVVSKDLSKVSRGFMSGPVLLLNDEGGIKDDIMLYNLSEDKWLAVVNAPNVEKDLEWMIKLRERFGFSKSDVEIENVTLKSVLIAVQGPKALDIMESLGLGDVAKLKILEFIERPKVLDGEAVLVSRSGWTGEEVRSYGFEIWADVNLGRKVFEKIVELGARPAGLIARDTLRLEMGYLLIGVDMDEDINPIEARYWLPLSLDKTECVGCAKVRELFNKGVKRFRVGFRLKKGVRVIPRHNDKVVVDGRTVGFITSGAFSPYLKRSIAMGYIDASCMYIGFKVGIEIRGKVFEAKIVDFPFI